MACGGDDDDGGGSGGSGTGGAATGGAAGGGGTSGDGSAGTGGGGTGGGVGGGWNPDGGISTCQGHTYECGDTLDNDGDGLKDSQDPDCLSPHRGLVLRRHSRSEQRPMQGRPRFDQDTGPGNDDCYWNHGCDPLSVAPDYPPGRLELQVRRECQDPRDQQVVRRARQGAEQDLQRLLRPAHAQRL